MMLNRRDPGRQNTTETHCRRYCPLPPESPPPNNTALVLPQYFGFEIWVTLNGFSFTLGLQLQKEYCLQNSIRRYWGFINAEFYSKSKETSNNCHGPKKIAKFTSISLSLSNPFLLGPLRVQKFICNCSGQSHLAAGIPLLLKSALTFSPTCLYTSTIVVTAVSLT